MALLETTVAGLGIRSAPARETKLVPDDLSELEALRDGLTERLRGVWQVRPRLGLIGMLAGWWHVKLSSGCPLVTARRAAPG